MPYEPGRPAFASLRRTQEDLAALAGRPDRGTPRAGSRVRQRRARAPGAASLLGCSSGRAAARRGRPLPRGRGRARLARARRRVDSRACRRRVAARADRARRAGRRALARAARDGARHARDPVRDRGPHSPRPDVVRAGAALAAPLRVAAGWAPRPLRLPPLAVLGLWPLERRLPRGPVARPGRLDARVRGRGDDPAPRRPAACRPSRRSAAPRVRSMRFEDLRRRCCGTRTGSTRRPSARRAAPTCAPTTPSRASWTSSTAGRRSAANLRATRFSVRSSTPRCGWARPASAAAWRYSTSPASVPAASMPSSCSASRRGRCPVVASHRRSSTTMRAASSTSAPRPA